MLPHRICACGFNRNFTVLEIFESKNFRNKGARIYERGLLIILLTYILNAFIALKN